MLHVTLLGEQAVADAHGTVRLRSSRTVALLAFLVVHAGAPQTRQRIAATFWPDSGDEQAKTNLRRELHHLRTVLGDAADASLLVTARDLAWVDSPACGVDVRAFTVERETARTAHAAGDRASFLEHAGAAIERYRGEFLPGSYDDWALAARSTLEQHAVDLLDGLGTARAATGDPAGAVEAARRRVQLRPLEEVGYRSLIQLQGDLGDRAGAVSTYHHCASVLERELGVEPDRLTRETLNRLLARPAGSAPAAPEPRARAGRLGDRLVGRRDELTRLHECWTTAATGRPGLVLVRGEPGVGKSRLMTELGQDADQGGAVVAKAQCFGSSGRLALAPVADWLRTPAVRSALAGLDGVWRAEVDRLVPATGTRAAPGPGPRAMVDAWQRHRFFEGLTRALLQVDRPLLLMLDNLHWCDQETLAFVTFCLGLVPEAPVLVVATMRDEQSDQEPGLPSWIARMRATGQLTEIALGPLETAESAALAGSVTGRTPTSTEADLLQATTGGFPLYIVEAARGGGAQQPLPVRDLSAVLVNRLAQVSPAARAVAGLAAAVGRDVTLDLLTEASDLDADAVVSAVDELWRSRIVREVGDGYAFSHDLLREAAYDQISPPGRWLRHRRVAQALELLHADDTDAVSAQLAEQYARGGRGERAIGYYRRAADVAAGMFAHTEAIRLHKAALAIVATLPDGLDRNRHELAVQEAVAAPLNARFGYASPQVRQTLERCIELADLLGRRESKLNALVGLWSSLFVHGETAAAHRTGLQALELVEPNSPLAGPAHFAVGGAAVSLGRPAEALGHLATAAELGGTHALSVGTRPDVHGRAFAAHAHWLLGHDEQALTSATDAIALARTTGNSYALAVALAYGAITHQLRDDRPELQRTTGELQELCERYSYAYYREWALILGGWVHDDEALVRRGIDGLAANGAFARMPYWLTLSADLAERNGRPDAARGALDAALAGGRARDDTWWLPEVMRRRAAHDAGADGVERLRDGARLAAGHGSVALLERCRADLAARGVPLPAFAVPAPT